MRPGKFTSQEIANELDMNTQYVYQHIRDFIRFGFVEKAVQVKLPEDAWDWSSRRRRSFRKEMGISRRTHYVFKPEGLLKVIETKIEELQRTRERYMRVFDDMQ